MRSIAFKKDEIGTWKRFKTDPSNTQRCFLVNLVATSPVAADSPPNCSALPIHLVATKRAIWRFLPNQPQLEGVSKRILLGLRPFGKLKDIRLIFPFSNSLNSPYSGRVLMVANVSFMGVPFVVGFRSSFQTFLLMPFEGRSSRAMFTRSGNFFRVKYRNVQKPKILPHRICTVTQLGSPFVLA